MMRIALELRARRTAECQMRQRQFTVQTPLMKMT